MSRSRGRFCALVLLATFALGNAGIASMAVGAWRAAGEPVAAMPCHGVPTDPTPQQADTSRCQWASPAACCDSPQTVDTRGADVPAPIVIRAWLEVEPRFETRVSSERAPGPPLPVPRSTGVLLI